MVKKNVLYKIKGYSDRCGFFCMFSSVISYLYNENDNVFIHWENDRYDKSKNNVNLNFQNQYFYFCLLLNN